MPPGGLRLPVLGRTGRCRGPLESRSSTVLRSLLSLGSTAPSLQRCRVRAVDHPNPIVRGSSFTSPYFLRGDFENFSIAADNPSYRAKLIKRATLQEHLFLCGACGACGAVRVKPLQLHWLGRATFRGAEIVGVGHVGQANVARAPHAPHGIFHVGHTSICEVLIKAQLETCPTCPTCPTCFFVF